MDRRAQRKGVPSPRFLRVPGLVFYALALLVMGLFVHLRNSDRGYVLDDFRGIAERRADALEGALDRSLFLLGSLVSFYDASTTVDRDEFGRFAAHHLPNHPGVETLAWIPRVTAETRGEIEMIAREEGLEGFQFIDRGPDASVSRSPVRDEHFPILFAAPHGDHEGLVGIDLTSLPEVSATLVEARDTGNCVTQTPLDGSTEDILLVRAVYDQGGMTMTAEGRRESLRGFLFVRLDFERLFRAALVDIDGEGSPLVVRLSERDDPVFRDGPTSEGRGEERGPLLARTIGLGDRAWTIESRATMEFIAAHGSLIHWAFMVGGLIAAGLIALVLRSYLDRTARVEALVGRRTEELGRANDMLEKETTELRAAESRLRASEERFRCFFDSSSDCILVWDLNQVCLYANRTAIDQLELDPMGLVGRRLADVLSHVPDLCEAWCHLAEEVSTSGATRHLEVETMIGERAMSGDTALSPIRDGKSEIFAVGVVCRDVTERRGLEMELVQARRLESIGQLAGGIAHEINTPIQFIGDNNRFLLESFGSLSSVLKQAQSLVAEENETKALDGLAQAIDDVELEFLEEEIPRAITESLTGVEHVAKIVQAMKAFSHPGGEEKGVVDINGSIQTTVTMSRNEWKYVAEMELDLADHLPVFRGNAGGVNQVLLNLIVNAAHAIGEKNGPNAGATGKITVQTRGTEDEVEIRIRDSGAGIPEEIRARIFDPFFTTKTVGKGTGQGLSLAHTVIVDQHGGTIAVESEVGEGTTMIVRLPCT